MPTDEATLRKEYERRLGHYKELETEVRFILEGALKKAGIQYHLVASRIKTFESFLTKAQRIEATRPDPNPFEEINDICGIRVIALFLSDLKRIRELFAGSLDIVEVEDKIQDAPPEFFGYMSVHLIARIPARFTGPRYDALKDLKCEIQVRTITMDAWASVSHYLDYKSQTAVPSDLRKDFLALSGLFYVADTHFEMFFRQRERSREQVAEKAEAEDLSNAELNLDTLAAFLVARYSDREHAESGYVSELLDELTKTHYTTIGQLTSDLDRTAKAFAQYESDLPRGPGGRYPDTTVVRASLLILGGPFLETVVKKYSKTITDSKTLMNASKNIIKKRFDPYHHLVTR